MISVILPVYNQALFITDIVEQYQEVLKKLPASYELLLVVNHSNDDSLQVCQNCARKYSNIKVLSMTQKGWGRAVKMGLKEAMGDHICYTNSARTTAQDLLLFLLYSIANPTTVIKANRKVRDSWKRRVGSLFYNLECRALFDLFYWDVNGTPKIFPKEFTRLKNLSSENDLIDLEFNVICKQENYPMIEIPTVSSRRYAGRSTTGYKSALALYWGAFRLWCQRDKIFASQQRQMK